MNYTVVYDVTFEGFKNWWVFLACLAMLFSWFHVIRRQRKMRAFIPPILQYTLLGVLFIFTIFALIGLIFGHLALAASLWNGRCQVIEGEVSDFHPMPVGGHNKEWFSVGRHRFEYSDYILSPGFNNTASHGGPIKNGLKVKIHSFKGIIAKLEISE